MTAEKTDTVIVGAGQAGLAMSAHLRDQGIDHIILEKDRIAERWRTARWDSLVANGPAWHDRFPAQEFAGIGGDDFATRDEVVRYFETFAENVDAPVRCGVEVTSVTRSGAGGFVVGNILGADRCPECCCGHRTVSDTGYPPGYPRNRCTETNAFL